jgi:hypothetical protein
VSFGINVVLDSVPDGRADPVAALGGVDSVVVVDPLVSARARDVLACVALAIDAVALGASDGDEDVLSVSRSQAATTAIATRTDTAGARRTGGNFRMDAAFRRCTCTFTDGLRCQKVDTTPKLSRRAGL